MSEAVGDAVKHWVADNRKILGWTVFLVMVLSVAVAVKEVTTLILTSYFIALLIDPMVSLLARRSIPRGLSVVIVCGFALLIFGGLLAVGIPIIIAEGQTVLKVLPGFCQAKGQLLIDFIHSRLGIELSLHSLVAEAREFAMSLDESHLKTLWVSLQGNLLKGYSFALTVVNLALLPFFVYYFSADLSKIHTYINGMLPVESRPVVSRLGSEILSHLYAFFKGQFTVGLILAILYITGLWVVGCPHAFFLGALTGLLNIVPYLGVGTGFVMAVILSLIADSSVWSVLKVVSVFVVVQVLEGSIITPKIVGESVGIHPLGIIVALIVGGQLFGLLGMILAIPAAAALRVIFRYILQLGVN